MRTLSSTLDAKQKKMGRGITKIDLTKTGSTSYTYYIQTGTDKIISIDHDEEPYNQKASVAINNSSKNLTSINFEGYQGILSYGYTTSAGDEYSPTSPLRVIFPTLQSFAGGLVVHLSLAGIPNLLNEDHASEDYLPASTDTSTVKTLLTAILNATLAPFSHCVSYTVTYDTEDSLIDSFIPKDSLRIYVGDTRLAVIKKLLRYTRCVMRAEDDGEVHIREARNANATTWAASTAYSLRETVKPVTSNNHIYVCTTAGTSGGSAPTWGTTVDGTTTDNTVVWTLTYDYQYDLASGNHQFFEATKRRRILIPGKITVESDPSSGDSYTGSAQDADYSTYPSVVQKEEYKQLRLASSAQATSIAKAILTQYQMDSEIGHGVVPMNVGQEVHDLVRLHDTRGDTYVHGNVGYISRKYEPGKYQMEMRFGSMAIGGVAMPSLVGTSQPSTIRMGDLTKSMAEEAVAQIDRLWSILQKIAESLDKVWNTLTEVVRWVNDTERRLDYMADVILDHERRITAVEPGVIGVIAVDATTDLSVADGKAYVPVPADFNGMNLTRAQAIVITAGTTNATTIDIYNVTDSVDMLSTAISIASGAKVGTVGTIDTTKDDVATNDVLRVDVTTMSTTAPKGLLIILEFKLPNP